MSSDTRRKIVSGHVDYPLDQKTVKAVRHWLDYGPKKSPFTVVQADTIPIGSLEESPDDYSPAFNWLEFTRQTWQGPAPWAGVPFAYRWETAHDQYGRYVASEETSIYVLDSEMLAMRGWL